MASLDIVELNSLVGLVNSEVYLRRRPGSRHNITAAKAQIHYSSVGSIYNVTTCDTGADTSAGEAVIYEPASGSFDGPLVPFSEQVLDTNRLLSISDTSRVSSKPGWPDQIHIPTTFSLLSVGMLIRPAVHHKSSPNVAK